MFELKHKQWIIIFGLVFMREFINIGRCKLLLTVSLENSDIFDLSIYFV